MNHDFRKLKALVINDYRPTQNMLVTCLKLLGFQSVTASNDASNAYASFMQEKHDVIISEIIDGRTDGIGFARKARESTNSPNEKVPVICIAGPRAAQFSDRARAVGLIEFLSVPYSIEDIAARLAFVLRSEFYEGFVSAKPKPVAAAKEAIPQAAPSASAPPPPAPPPETQEEKESKDLTALLLDHYLKHHEVVLKKLHFAKDATNICVEQLRETTDKLKAEDKKDLSLKNEFEKMWAEILEQFVEGGIAEEDLAKIETVIETIPSDIKAHYNDLTSKDQEFLDLVESMNVSAYKAAKAMANKAQSKPNILSGMTAQDYQAAVKKPAAEAPQAAAPKVEKTVIEKPAEKSDWRFIKK